MSFNILFKSMSFVTSKGNKLLILTSLLFLADVSVIEAAPNEKIIEFTRDAALKHGAHLLASKDAVHEKKLVEFGQAFFETKALSNTNDIACVDCHLPEFGSSDGLPVSVGLGGVGKGLARARSGGEIIPRNALPLWGRGEPDFKAFFWDGRVERTADGLVSQFGAALPSQDALVVAIHLPVVEIREMMAENEVVSSVKVESAESAGVAYETILNNLNANEPKLMESFLGYLGYADSEDLTFLDIARAIAAFIRAEFAVAETRFSNFLSGKDVFSESELQGAYLFYGKAKCVACHSGPHFSNFQFYTIGFPQLGFGRNGFGIDYGRYNTTHNPSDLYRFRVAPLWNVANTGPYGHSGSVATLSEAITQHYDPLKNFDPTKIDKHERVEFYKVLLSASDAMATIPQLTENETSQLAAFLRTLSFTDTQL